MARIENYFKTKKNNITMGVEVEMYLYNAQTEELLDVGEEDSILLDECLKELPDTITKDHYNYQLEVRTRPHNNPEDLIKEFEENLLLCRKVFSKRGIEIKPLSWLGGNENFNGVHFHFRNGSRMHYQNIMFNMYPFVLALTDCFKNSVDTENNVSRRIANSCHIGIPQLKNLAIRLIGESRYKDIIVNGYVENTRHRLKKEPTIEIRSFDVPYNFEYFKNLVRLMYGLFAYINSSEEIKNYSDEDIEKYISMTRRDIQIQRRGYNFILDMDNVNVYKYLCNKFSIKELIVPIVVDKTHPIRNRDDLREYWRRLGTKVWLGEDKFIIKKVEPKQNKIEAEGNWRMITPELSNDDLDEEEN